MAPNTPMQFLRGFLAKNGKICMAGTFLKKTNTYYISNHSQGRETLQPVYIKHKWYEISLMLALHAFMKYYIVFKRNPLTHIKFKVSGIILTRLRQLPYFSLKL